MKLLMAITFGAMLVNGAYALDEIPKKEKRSKGLGSIIPSITPSKEQVLGGVLKGALENIHLTRHKLDDDLSEKAFKLYVERIDYGKQFLIKSDVAKLEKFEEQFDDQMREGKLKIVKISSAIMKERIPQISSYVEGLLKGKFDFSKKEFYETDSKKRTFAKSIDELKNRWRKLIKLEVLVQYLDLKDEQDGVNDKDKKKKKKKKVVKKKTKKLSKKELIAKSQKKVLKRYKKIFKRLWEEKESDKMDKFYNSITRVYDPHTLYLVPEEKEDFDIDMSGKLEGIGALLREEGSFIKVERIIPGSASWKGKELKAEDVILAVGQDKKDVVDIVDMSIRDAVKLIRGPKDSVVRLKVKKPDGSIKFISIIRDEVILEESFVKASILEHKKLDKKIGYIFVPKFYRDFQDRNGRNCSTDVKIELERFNKKNVDAVILDLRNNGGGALEDARLMAGLFIDKGPIVQVKNQRGGGPQIHKDTDGKTYWDKPVVVLINRFSASASEIVAGALKDYNRAVVIGSSEQTHGKGTVQTVMDLNSYLNPVLLPIVGKVGALKITTDMFYRINGQSTQFRGVKPHIELPDQFSYLESGERTLDHAIPYNKIDSLDYKKWKNLKVDIDDLDELSQKRISKSKAFKKINESVEWFTKRKETTERSLKIADLEKYRKESREATDKFKVEAIDKDLKVTSLKKVKNDADKERAKEYVEGLQKDPVLQETLLIIKDLFNLSKK